MKQLNAAHFRRNMSKTFDACEESSELVLITTNKGNDKHQRMIVMSEEEYIKLTNLK